MAALTMSTERLRQTLADIEERGLDLQLCPAQDIPGPGGGVYIARQTPLTAKHLEWLESRSPARDEPAYVEVRFVSPNRGEVEAPPAVDPDPEPAPEAQGRQDRARHHAQRVAGAAREVADRATGIYRSLGKLEFTAADLRRQDAEAGLRQFERSFVELHGAVKKALDEYLHGNTLVLDLILRYQLDRQTVRHGLSVAAFATEMATLLALRHGERDDLSSYFGEATDADLLADLGRGPDDLAGVPEAAPEAARRQQRLALFREELVEIFLAGFMHDCGLWTEPFCLPEGHEVKGARLIAETAQVQRFAPSLVKAVLFHSDIVRLARKGGVVKVTESPDDPERATFRREFFDDRDDAVATAELYSGDAHGEVLTAADLRKVLPVALAEHFVSHTRDIYQKPEVEVINDLAQHVRAGPFQGYLVVLCNSRVEVVAPRRALVRLAGHLSIMVDDRRDARRAVRLDVDGFDAGSLGHGRDRNSPHLITLFLRRRDGSREKAAYVDPHEGSLWERAAGVDSRMYIGAGRYRNNLSYRVTGFMGEEVFARVLGEYEQEFARRNP